MEVTELPIDQLVDSGLYNSIVVCKFAKRFQFVIISDVSTGCRFHCCISRLYIDRKMLSIKLVVDGALYIVKGGSAYHG